MVAVGQLMKILSLSFSTIAGSHSQEAATQTEHGVSYHQHKNTEVYFQLKTGDLPLAATSTSTPWRHLSSGVIMTQYIHHVHIIIQI